MAESKALNKGGGGATMLRLFDYVSKLSVTCNNFLIYISYLSILVSLYKLSDMEAYIQKKSDW